MLGGIVNSEFDWTLARRLDQRCFPPVLRLNQIVIKFGIGRSTTSELGLTSCIILIDCVTADHGVWEINS